MLYYVRSPEKVRAAEKRRRVQEHGQRTVGLEDRLKELCDKMNTAGAYTYALRVKIGAVLAQAATKTEILTRQADVSNVKKE